MSNLTASIRQITAFVKESKGNLVVLTGAGISTGSGIPDYRGPNGVYSKNKDYKPIQYQQFVKDHGFRQRYWARSLLGWPQVQTAKPNETHRALVALREKGWTRAGVITQNVDGLLGKDTLELHGTLYRVECISCDNGVHRADFQEALLALNPDYREHLEKHKERITIGMRESRPDGDAEVAMRFNEFRYPSCDRCETGLFKPNVVFFGENMKQHVRERSFDMVDNATHMLIVGTSMTVYSAFRLLKHAKTKGLDVSVINLGAFRGSEMADIIVDASSDAILPEVARALGANME
ncbi:DHS-like NAD/FAD-binding domain-containing protein [Chytriomyces sp. MP71]|nr:DHS-like NAD/FAD-binding domain-containing protein [Chytriomyces sp. MP71]